MTTTSATAVRLDNVSRSFGAVQALRSISLNFEAGTVNALVGENGAGKSTALGILGGRIPATHGTVQVFGQELRTGDPRASRRAGVVAIYQELTVVPALSAEANVFLAGPLTRLGILSERAMRRRYVELCRSLGVDVVPPGVAAGRLSVAQQQLLEILRAVVSEARVILFDEPTASLAVPEREALYRLIERLKADGVTSVFVSHNLDEVLQLADTVTVFRDGQLTASGPRGEFSKQRLVTAMLGAAADARLSATFLNSGAVSPQDPIGDAETGRRRRRRAHDSALLRVVGVTVPGALEAVDLEVRAGEMVGIGGLVGSGRTTLLRALAGLEPTSSGRMWIDGAEVRWPRSVRRALGYGIALVPEDRKGQGLVLGMSAAENIALSDYRPARRYGLLTPRGIERIAGSVATGFGFRPERLRARAWQLSGGNQQKLLLARWLHRRPRLLLADEPTRGVDVGAKAEILRSLEAMAADGMGLLLVSSELEEITACAQRVVVLSEGQYAGCLDTADAPVTPPDILALAFRVHDAA